MPKSPAFQFYPKDFLSDINVASMTMEERGVYITLLSYCWLEGCLKGGLDVVQAICNHPQNWDKIWVKVGMCFYENDGNFYHKRLEEEKKKQAEWREKSRLGGIKSGKVRRKLKGGSQMVEPKGNSSSSSSSLKKTNKRKTFLPENYQLTIKHINYANDKKIMDGIEDMFEDFCIHHRKVGTKFTDWYAAWQTWVRNKIKWGKEKQQQHQPKILTKADIDRLNA